MTPEERAKLVADRLRTEYANFPKRDPVEEIAAALREAVDAERERCAGIAEETCCRCHETAAAIRSRPEPSPPTYGLPPGMTMSPDGTISGVPTTPGTYRRGNVEIEVLPAEPSPPCAVCGKTGVHSCRKQKEQSL